MENKNIVTFTVLKNELGLNKTKEIIKKAVEDTLAENEGNIGELNKYIQSPYGESSVGFRLSYSPSTDLTDEVFINHVTRTLSTSIQDKLREKATSIYAPDLKEKDVNTAMINLLVKGVSDVKVRSRMIVYTIIL